MHRHGYKGRKFGRERDQRKALIKGLADSLIINESIETTLEKAKDLRPYVEKLVTKAKKGDLHNRRLVIQGMQTKAAANKLFDDIAPKVKRDSGYLRIERTDVRRGDNAQMAKISFVDDLKAKTIAKSTENKSETKTTEKTSTTKKEAKQPKTASKKPATKKTSKTEVK